jgi:hypothetical protein
MHPDKLMNLSRAFQCLLPLVDASFAVSPRVVAAETPAKKLADMKLFSSPAINAAENNHQLIPKDLKNHFRLVLENAIAESFVLGKLD